MSTRSTAEPSIRLSLPACLQICVRRALFGRARLAPAAVAIAAVLGVAAALAPPAAAIVHSHVETFTTTQYKDAATTTAVWDTGASSLHLAPFVPALAGSTGAAKGMRVCISGNYAYVNAGGLAVVDIGDPASPTVLGSTTTTGSAYDLAVQGRYAYAGEINGMRIFDISDPTAPVSIAVYPVSFALGVSVDGEYAYLACNTDGLRVVEIIDPALPTLVGSHVPGQALIELEVVGDHAYVAGTAGLLVYDVSNRAAPVPVGSYATSGAVRYVEVDGDYAYLCVVSNGLIVVDISDPTSPTFAGQDPFAVNPVSVTVSGDRAWLADHVAGVREYDVSDPTSPQQLHNIIFGPISNIAVAGEYAFASGHLFGLGAIRARDPIPPVLVANTTAPDDAWDVDVSGNHAYVASGASGLKVLDISDPASPALVGSYDTPSFAYAVKIVGDLACVADSTDLLILDVSDPTTPAFVGSGTTPGAAEELDVLGTVAYVADLWGLTIMDISSPGSPSFVSSYPSVGGTHDVQVESPYAYLADGTSGFVVLDVSNAGAPTVVGGTSPGGTVFGVAVAGSYAYVIGTSAMKVIDISDPTTPTVVATAPSGSFGREVSLSGQLAFITGYSTGIYVIDIGNPVTPVLVSTADAAQAQDLLAWGRYLFVPRGTYGMDVFQVFQSEYDTDNNVGRSLNINPDAELVISARVEPVQNTAASWEVSANNGDGWDVLPSDGSWALLNTSEVPGLRWRATLPYGTPGQVPAVQSVRIDWRYEFPVIVTSSDIPNDQGGHVLLEWNPSGYDQYNQRTITHYSVWRALNPAPGAGVAGADPNVPGLIHPADVGEHFEGPGIRVDAAGYYWEWLGNVTAQYFDGYAFSAPTYYDSVGGDPAMHYFQVIAHTADQWTFYTSYPDSGYSVDNLAPGVPQGVAAAYNTGAGNMVSWDENTEPDLQLYRVYRSTDPGFVPGPATLVAEIFAVTWNDPEYDGWDVTYKVTAVDHAGNESPPGSPATATGIRGPAAPRTVALYPNVPNPFNPSTTIRYDVPPGTGDVDITVYDVTGRRIRTLVSGSVPARAREVTWNGRDDRGRAVASGVYFYRLRTGSTTLTRRMVLLK